MRSRNPFDEKEPVPVDPYQLRPDQKRCRRCKAALLLEQQRCPFCGNSPWLWHPNSRFLVVSIIIAIFLMFLLPLMMKKDRPESASVSISDPP